MDAHTWPSLYNICHKRPPCLKISILSPPRPCPNPLPPHLVKTQGQVAQHSSRDSMGFKVTTSVQVLLCHVPNLGPRQAMTPIYVWENWGSGKLSL